jgi:hypothetical protein
MILLNAVIPLHSIANGILILANSTTTCKMVDRHNIESSIRTSMEIRLIDVIFKLVYEHVSHPGWTRCIIFADEYNLTYVIVVPYYI